MSIVNYTGVFIVSVILSTFAIIISNYKNFKYKSFLFIFLLNSIVLFFLFYDGDCNYKIFKSQSAIIQPIIKNFEKLDFINKKLESYMESTQDDIPASDIKLGMSGAVFVNSLNIAKTSIADKPLGWGLDRYEYAYLKYVINEKDKHNLSNYHKHLFDWNLNMKDGSNNLAKIITEYGLFSIGLFIFFVYFSFSSKSTLEEKAFLIPLVLTQLIRGAGYYNGGFILCIILMFMITAVKSEN